MRNSLGLAVAALLGLVNAASAAPPGRDRAAAIPADAPVSIRAGPLSLAEVLVSSRFHAPQVLEALARLRGAEGRLLSAQAAFDTVFSASAETRLSGFYDGRDVEAKVTKPLGSLGGYAYGG